MSNQFGLVVANLLRYSYNLVALRLKHKISPAKQKSPAGRKQLRVFFILTLISPCIFAEAISNNFDANIKKIIQSSLPNAFVGMIFIDSSTGKVLYERNSNQRFSPASVTKLFTATAALYKLGPTYQYKTRVSKKDNNVYLKFVGDPSFTKENLQELVSSLKENNISHIKGDIILDTNRFKSPDYPPGLSYEDIGWYYAAPINTVIIDENFIAYEFNSNNSFNSKPTIKLLNVNDAGSMSINNQLKIVDMKYYKNHCDIDIKYNSPNEMTLYGCIPKKIDKFTQRLSLSNPVLLAKQIIRASLAKENIVLDGSIKTGTTPLGAVTVFRHKSSPLSELAAKMLLESDNTYANSFAKTLAYEVTKDGTFKQAVFAIKKILSKNTSVDTANLTLSDGAGNRFNLISPKQVSDLLLSVHKNKEIYKVLTEALPKSGHAGSLKYRMTDKDLNGKVVAKTGTFHDVVALAGYLHQKNGHPIIFAIMSNNITGKLRSARQMEELILRQFI